jgi:hypothetical protein
MEFPAGHPRALRSASARRRSAAVSERHKVCSEPKLGGFHHATQSAQDGRHVRNANGSSQWRPCGCAALGRPSERHPARRRARGCCRGADQPRRLADTQHHSGQRPGVSRALFRGPGLEPLAGRRAGEDALQRGRGAQPHHLRRGPPLTDSVGMRRRGASAGRAATARTTSPAMRSPLCSAKTTLARSICALTLRPSGPARSETTSAVSCPGGRARSAQGRVPPRSP